MFERPLANWLLALAALAAVIVVPLSIGNQYYIEILANIGINVILVLGLNVITGTAGQLSLCEGSFSALGAYGCALLVMRAGLSFWVALPAATLGTGIVGLIVGVPALRLRGHYLVMLTLGLAVLVEQVLTNWVSLTGGPAALIGIPWPGPIHLGVFDIGVATRERYYVLIVLVVALVIYAMLWLNRSRLGISLRSLRDDETAAELMGIDTRLCKLIAFTLSALLGGLAGGLYAHFAKILSPDEFGVMESVSILMMLIVGGIGSVAGSVIGAVILTVLPELLRAVEEWRLVVYGVALMVIVSYFPQGIISGIRRLLPSRRAARRGADMDGAGDHISARTGEDELLVIDRLAKHFAGLVAVSEVSMTVKQGEIVGLIGPNGSGKTTLLNLISGALRPSGGEIRLGGRHFRDVLPHELSHAGISRTFQKIRLFRGMTVLDNVVAAMAPRHVPAMLSSFWRGRVFGRPSQDEGRAMRLLGQVGLERRAAELARNLSYGEQRMLEIARALATNPGLLLLDEPAAGLSHVDMRLLETAIAGIRAAGIAVILVEHHMRFLMSTATRVIVLNFGKVIFDGPPAAAQRNEAVMNAYLGTRRNVR
ncbi:MAG: ABC transporter permease subunit [Stellaceae bacterium]